MVFKKIALTGIVLGIGLVGVGCQTQNQGGGLSRQSTPRFIEEPDTTDYVADQLRREATNLVGGYNRK